jgi:hypothetical protein
MMSMNIVADLSSNRTPRFGWTSGWPVNRCSLNFFPLEDWAVRCRRVGRCCVGVSNVRSIYMRFNQRRYRGSRVRPA